jgi:hypothetical protein
LNSSDAGGYFAPGNIPPLETFSGNVCGHA